MDNTPLLETRPRWWLRRLSRRFKLAHRKTQLIAGAQGMGLFFGLVLAVDAAFVATACDRYGGNTSIVGSLLRVPCDGGRTCCRGCFSNSLILVEKSESGEWSVPVPTTDEQAMINLDRAASSDGVTSVGVMVLRPASSGFGVWSPTLASRSCWGCMTCGGASEPAPKDEAAIRAAVVQAWPALSATLYYSFSGSTLTERDKAALSGAGPRTSTFLHPGWLLNDLLVVGTVALLVMGGPERRKRAAQWRSQLDPQPLTHCPCCGYDLAGLVTTTDGDRRCPECGVVCGEFFVVTNPQGAGQAK